MMDESIRVVFDTNVVVDAIWHRDPDCSDAIYAAKAKGHTVVVCSKLLEEYRRVLRGNGNDIGFIADRVLMQTLPGLEKHADPSVEIAFGPEHDRYHMQLAINSRASCHVTNDKGILVEAENMAHHGVKEVRPRKCKDCWE